MQGNAKVASQDAGSYVTRHRAAARVKLPGPDSGLVKIHYSDLRILLPVGGRKVSKQADRQVSSLDAITRTLKAPVAFLSLGPRYLDGGYRFITQPEIFAHILHSARGLGTRLYVRTRMRVSVCVS